MNKIVHLNQTYPEFSLEEVELRLETDPLTLGGLIDLNDPSDITYCEDYTACVCNGVAGNCTSYIHCMEHYLKP